MKDFLRKFFSATGTFMLWVGGPMGAVSSAFIKFKVNFYVILIVCLVLMAFGYLLQKLEEERKIKPFFYIGVGAFWLLILVVFILLLENVGSPTDFIYSIF